MPKSVGPKGYGSKSRPKSGSRPKKSRAKTKGKSR